MAEPIKTKTLGGLTYNANQVKTAQKRQDGKYELIFKSGEKLVYPEQNQKMVTTDYNNAEGFYYANGDQTRSSNINTNGGKCFYDGKPVTPKKTAKPEVKLDINSSLIYDDTYFDIKDVMGATFTTSEKTVSHVTLTDSENTTIDLAANDSRWYGDNATIKNGENNTVKLDSNDSARINGKRVEGKGEADQKDYE